MTAWGTLIEPIIAEDSFVWRELNVIEKLFAVPDSLPSLALYNHLVLDSNQVQGGIRFRVEVSHIFAVDLQRWDLNWKLFIALLSESLNLFEDEGCCPGKDTAEFINIRLKLVVHKQGVGRPLHCESLPSSCLTVCEDANVLSIKGTLNKRLNFIKDILLIRWRRKYTVKMEHFVLIFA